MVNAVEWLEKNYPIDGTCQRAEDKENYGKTRSQITKLDVSNQNLEGNLNISINFNQLRKLNASFNKIDFYSFPVNLEEIDFSHNYFNSFNIQDWKIKKFNISSNYVKDSGSSFAGVSFLTHLDCSNNLLTKLDLSYSSKNLIELKCSGNSITNLSLGEAPNLLFFDCLGTKLTTLSSSSLFPSPTSTALATTTVCTNNPALLGSTIGLGVYSGISTLG
jgi:hypothetical protein